MKPVFALAALLTFGCFPCVADPPPVAVPPVLTPFPAPPFDENVSTVIPFEFLDNHIFINALVNGQNARLLLDTGTANISLTQEFVRKNGLKDDGGSENTIIGAGGVVKARRVLFHDIAIENIKLQGENSDATVLPLVLPPEWKCDGIIGYELFYALVVMIDYEHLRVIFTRPEDFKAPNAGLPLRVDGRLPAVESVLDERHVWVELDTGDGSGLTLNSPFVAHEKLRQVYVPHFRVAAGDGIGGKVSGDVARAKSLTIGDFTILKPLVLMSNQQSGAETQSDVDGRIGNAILKNFYLTFDYGRKRLYLTPRTDLTKVSLRLTVPGFDMNADVMHKLYFKDVLANGPAAQAGIRNGDEVLAVNDVLLEKLRGTMVHWTTGDKVKFLVRRKPGMKPFTTTFTVGQSL